MNDSTEAIMVSSVNPLERFQITCNHVIEKE
jgi:hypothetical protein